MRRITSEQNANHPWPAAGATDDNREGRSPFGSLSSPPPSHLVGKENKGGRKEVGWDVGGVVWRIQFKGFSISNKDVCPAFLCAWGNMAGGNGRQTLI